MWKALAGAVAAAILLAPLGGAQEGPTIAGRVATLEEQMVVVQIDQTLEAEMRRRDDRRLARCVAKPTRERRLACAERFLEWTR